MRKALRKGHCPRCGRACRAKWLGRLPEGEFEIFQPYCARCTERRGKHGPGEWSLLFWVARPQAGLGFCKE